MKHCRLVIPTLLLLSCSFAQIAPTTFESAPSSRSGTVKVHVAFPEGTGCGVATHVSLIGPAGIAVAEGYTNSYCEIEFTNVPGGNYNIVVGGRDAASSVNSNITVDSRGGEDLEVRMTAPAYSGQPTGTGSVAFVPKADLVIPEKAKREFDKANDQIAKQEWKKALEQLNKAVAAYPGYAEAYNNMGAVYARLGDRAHEREVLQKAIGANDHIAAAYVNLARMDIVDRDFRSAETRLEKATAIDPLDAMTLVLLSNVQLMNLKYDDAIATTRKAHSMSAPHAVAHYVAARAFEAEHKPADALNELQIFLSEEQSGPRADAARKELAALKSAAR